MELTRWLPTCKMRPVRWAVSITALAVVDRLHHGLFAVHVFAGVHGVDAMRGCQWSGDRDDDGVDILARQHLAVIARGEDLVALDLLGARQPALVDVADGRQLHAAGGDRSAGVAAALYAVADQGHAHAIVGGRVLRRFRRAIRRPVARRPRLPGSGGG